MVLASVVSRSSASSLERVGQIACLWLVDSWDETTINLVFQRCWDAIPDQQNVHCKLTEQAGRSWSPPSCHKQLNLDELDDFKVSVSRFEAQCQALASRKGDCTALLNHCTPWPSTINNGDLAPCTLKCMATIIQSFRDAKHLKQEEAEQALINGKELVDFREQCDGTFRRRLIFPALTPETQHLYLSLLKHQTEFEQHSSDFERRWFIDPKAPTRDFGVIQSPSPGTGRVAASEEAEDHGTQWFIGQHEPTWDFSVLECKPPDEVLLSASAETNERMRRIWASNLFTST
eukprot:Gregarina_sp_Poly_1__1346@NODE_1333_length_4355_cov_224_001632_g897_i0_p2_GENE_NODE_1333_length_4355_cov_224_001632_g897_i0NODE_1333_length_4355_cov_224_001632_g897_i0_p2_ORF_typecomplete_len290_score31_97B2adaptapp_C/PF09066_10/0_3B2adaptapp_C/PF09066_10/3_3e03_NODE_1333_length_4355_cov_224_001632_g897_i023673236